MDIPQWRIKHRVGWLMRWVGPGAVVGVGAAAGSKILNPMIGGGGDEEVTQRFPARTSFY
jgi:hypothetical protein